MTAEEIIRLTADEFKMVSDDVLNQYIEIIRPMVSKKRFGNLYEQALAYLVCHKLKLSGFGENPLGDMGNIGVGFAIASVSEGGSSINFSTNQASNVTNDAEFGLTTYGVQYLSLRRQVVIPIMNSAEQGGA